MGMYLTFECRALIKHLRRRPEIKDPIPQPLTIRERGSFAVLVSGVLGYITRLDTESEFREKYCKFWSRRQFYSSCYLIR